MADLLPPIPYDQPQTSFAWIDWFTKLNKLVNAGGLDHNSLFGLQGGGGGDYYHLSSSNYTGLVGGSFTTLHKHEAFPVDSVFVTDSATDPSTILLYGTWTLLGTLTL